MGQKDVVFAHSLGQLATYLASVYGLVGVQLGLDGRGIGRGLVILHPYSLGLTPLEVVLALPVGAAKVGIGPLDRQTQVYGLDVLRLQRDGYQGKKCGDDVSLHRCADSG